jgi:hypothetical protein
MCFDFLLSNLSEKFFILRNTERDSNKMYIGLHVKYRYSCQFVKKLEFFRNIYSNIQVSNSSKLRPVGDELFHANYRTGRWTGLKKLIVAFRNFANAPKITVLLY